MNEKFKMSQFKFWNFSKRHLTSKLRGAAQLRPVEAKGWNALKRFVIQQFHDA